MFKLISQFIEKGFGKTTIIALLVTVTSNIYLCAKGKWLEADLQTKTAEIALVKTDNHHLANQLENANTRIEQFEKQVTRLHENVLAKMKASEERQNGILKALEKNKGWANQSVPSDIIGVFKQRNSVQNPSAHTDKMPQNPVVPNAPNRD